MATVNENSPVSQDAAANLETTYTMEAGDTFNGILDHKFDVDWVGIELERGKNLPDYPVRPRDRPRQGRRHHPEAVRFKREPPPYQ